MFLYREFGRQADQLYFACHKIVQQDIGMAISIKISYTNIQVRPPAIDGCCLVAQTDTLRYSGLLCIVWHPVVRQASIVRQQLILQSKYIQASLLAIIEQQIGEAIAGKVSAEFLVI